MNRLHALDAKYYLGAVSHSMEHLPKWYQIVAMCGIVSIIYLRDNPIVSWLVVNVHNSFGTEFIWYSKYQVLLEQMTFNERLCFTLYGVTLALTVVVMYKIFCRDTYGIGMASFQLFSDRKVASIGALVMLSLIEILHVRHDIAACLGEPGSLAAIAIDGFEGLEEHGYDPSLANNNPHLVVQVELLKTFAYNVFIRRLPVVLVGGAFRLFRDIPRRTHAALRWYAATGIVASAARDALVMYYTQTYNNLAAWATLLGAFIFVGGINYTYGQSKRAGMVVSVTVSNSIKEALRSMVTCTAIWCMTTIVVVTIIVSVHVVELFSLWLLISLLTVWMPAVIDSCSTDYITLLSGAAAFLAKSMGYLSVKGSCRFAALAAAWWIAASLGYNVVMNLTRQRYGGMAAVVWFFFWVIALPPDATTNAAAPATEAVSVTGLVGGDAVNTDVHAHSQELNGFFGDRIRWICRLADYDLKPNSGSKLLDLIHRTPFLRGGVTQEEQLARGREMFVGSLQTAVIFSIGCMLANYFIYRRRSADVVQKMRRRSITLVTPAVFSRKCVHTAVLVFCVGNFLFTMTLFRKLLLPRVINFLPNIVSQVISFSAGCVVFGALMDMKASMYDSVARFLGMLDPPLLNEDGTPIEEPQLANPDDEDTRDEETHLS